MATPATKIPAEVAVGHKLIGDELYYLYTKWDCFKLLFCSGDETISVLNYAAGFFFGIYREVLRDDIILSICRLTDPATTPVTGQDRSNLTLAHLSEAIPDSDASLRQTLEEDLKNLKSQIADFRQHRNRRIGHYDLDTRKGHPDALLPNLGLNETDDALAAISAFLNRIHQFYDQDENPYDMGIKAPGSGNTQELIDFITNEQSLRKYRKEKEFGV